MQSLPASTALTLYQAPALQVLSSIKSLVIVDPAVKDLAIVMHDLDTTAELLMLDVNQDGIAQITAKLQSCSALDNIHIVAPSCPGVMKLGKTCLNAASLETYRTQIESWRQALSTQANILLHGQNVAIGMEGMALVGRLSQLTGAVVAPSSLPVGTSHNATKSEFVLLAG